MHKLEALEAHLQASFCDQLEHYYLRHREITLVLKPEHLKNVCLALRDHEDFAFDVLIDLCGIDYLEYGKGDWETDSATSAGFSRGVEDDIEVKDYSGDARFPGRFAVVYHLLSTKHNRRLRLKVFANDKAPTVDSVQDIWSSANWYEREAFDLYGILFRGHPDLRRILTDYGFMGHPFRKDFPLIGEVEARFDYEQQRVVYEPVSIEPRTLVPKVLRSDQRHANTRASTGEHAEEQARG